MDRKELEETLSKWERAVLLRVTRDTRRMLGPWRSLDMRRLGRILTHSILVGAAAGVVACLFFYALEWTQWLLQGQIAGFEPLRPSGELHVTPHLQGAEPNRWLLALLPALGGLACGLLVQYFAPEAAGAGSDAYIDAVHNKRGQIAGRVPLVKMAASAITIGSGGSAGREGPVMQTSAGIGSALSRWLKLDDHERRILVVAGAAAGTGAIFRTPLGAALYAVEVLYRDDFESDAIVPSIIASVTGYSIFTTVFGQGHLFLTDESYPFHVASLPLYALMAVGLSLVGASFVAFRDWARDRFFGRMPVPLWALPAIGGLLLGLTSLLVPQALGAGYGLVQGAIEGAEWIPEGNVGFGLLLALAAAKILSVTLTITSGGSGGEFGPSLVIGGLVGGGFGLLFQQLAPTLVTQPGAFALVGMGALFGGIAHVPVSSLIMVCEMAGSYDLLVPLMLAEGITFVLLRGVRIYGKQVPTRVESPAHRDDITIDILESIRVHDVYEPGEKLPEVRPGAPLEHVLSAISTAHHPGVLVRSEAGKVEGLISLDAVQGSILDAGLSGLAVAADVMTRPEHVQLDDDLHVVLHAFLVSGMSVLPVSEPGQQGTAEHVGVITQLDVTRAYDEAVEARLAGHRQE
ncbi:MAG: chloride channel protein [Myxococcales bacterium]